MRTWHFDVAGSAHTVQVAHDPVFSGELEIYVDGEEVLNTVAPMGRGYEYKCEIDNKPCVVRIVTGGTGGGGMMSMSVNYEIIVDGEKQAYSGAEDLVPPRG